MPSQWYTHGPDQSASARALKLGAYSLGRGSEQEKYSSRYGDAQASTPMLHTVRTAGEREREGPGAQWG